MVSPEKKNHLYREDQPSKYLLSDSTPLKRLNPSLTPARYLTSHIRFKKEKGKTKLYMRDYNEKTECKYTMRLGLQENDIMYKKYTKKRQPTQREN